MRRQLGSISHNENRYKQEDSKKPLHTGDHHCLAITILGQGPFIASWSILMNQYSGIRYMY